MQQSSQEQWLEQVLNEKHVLEMVEKSFRKEVNHLQLCPRASGDISIPLV
jgi:hypothetical protein